MRAKYFNPFTDFGFKKLFGEEANKALLIDFLNALLPQERTIINISFKTQNNWGSPLPTEKQFMISIVKMTAERNLLLSFKKQNRIISASEPFIILLFLSATKPKKENGIII